MWNFHYQGQDFWAQKCFISKSVRYIWSLHLFWRKWNCHREWAFQTRRPNLGASEDWLELGCEDVRCPCWRSALRLLFAESTWKQTAGMCWELRAPFPVVGDWLKTLYLQRERFENLIQHFSLGEIDFASHFSKALFSCQSWWLLGNVTCEQVAEDPASRNRDCEFPGEV